MNALTKGMKHKELIERLIRSRVHTDDIASFLSPRYEDISDPSLLHTIDKAVARILRAMEGDEMIAVYSDYDADGVPGAVVMDDFFRRAGYTNYVVYIPHRHDEGYGMRTSAIDELHEKGVSLVITVDMGIRDNDHVAHASTHGIDVIITDHHEPGEVLPDAIAVVNPKIGDTYPDPMICGCAVAFQLVRACARALKEKDPKQYDVLFPEGWEKWLLDMVGIATISDMVPLVGENRIFAHFGLRVLQKTRRPGLIGLYQKVGVSPLRISEDDVAFSIAPRLNAASRMGHARQAFDLFVATNPIDIEQGTRDLEKMNTERKKQVALLMKKVHARMKREPEHLVVLGEAGWNHGVLGLLASQIVDQYSIPAFVWAEHKDGILKGSCRSNGSVDVFALMSALPEGVLVSSGGHAGAGGFSLKKENIHTLETVLKEVLLAGDFSLEPMKEEVTDGTLSLEDIDQYLFRELQLLAPFGKGNQKPVFLFPATRIEKVDSFGGGKVHLALTFTVKGKPMRAIAFFKNIESFNIELTQGKTVDVMAQVENSFFRGVNELRLRLVDVL